jgi:hypothetical protein
MKTAPSLRAAFTATAAGLLAATAALSAASSAGAAAPDVFSGERNVVLLPKNSEGILGIDRDLQATYAERQGARNQFVIVPTGNRFLVKTAKITRGGEPLCLQLAKKRVFVAACDAGLRQQQFSFRAASPSNGKKTWTIRTTRHRYLVQNELGGFESAVIGEGTPDIDTPFLIVDKGAASLPALD